MLPLQSTWELCFARGGVDQAATGPFQTAGVVPTGDYVITTGPLPDFVLEAGSFITLQRFSIAAGTAVVLQNIAVTYTPGAGAPAVLADALVPFLLPQATS